MSSSTSSKPTSKVSTWLVFNCTLCKREVHNAFGNQLCDECRNGPGLASESESDSSSDEEMEDATVWVVTIARDASGEDKRCDCGSWGPWLYKDKENAKARLLEELLVVFREEGIFQSAPKEVIEQYFNHLCDCECVCGEVGCDCECDCEFEFRPEFTKSVADVNYVIAKLSRRERPFYVHIDKMTVN